MKKLLIFVLILFMLPIVYSEQHIEQLDIKSSCVSEDIIIKIKGIKQLQDNEYNFIGCEKTKVEDWDWWKCNCSGQNIINFNFNTDYNNTYDIITQHYIDKIKSIEGLSNNTLRNTIIENNKNKRINTFNNIFFIPPKIIKEKRLINFNIDKLGIVLCCILFIIFIIFIFITKWLKKQLKDDDKIIKYENFNGLKKLEKKEVDDCINKYL